MELDKLAFYNWLKIYFKAWQTGDPLLLSETFTEDAVYNETPFEGKLMGRTQIYEYWKEGAQQSQEQVQFSFEIICVSADKGFAKWKTNFKRKASNVQVELDGIMEVVFNHNLKVVVFNEWWHRKESEVIQMGSKIDQIPLQGNSITAIKETE